MKRSTAMILTIVSILLCGCPGLGACAISIYALTLDQQFLVQTLLENGLDVTKVANPELYIWGTRLAWGGIALVLIAIPIIVGLITLRSAKKARSITG